ncbi:MAG: polyprenyl synthetase family protein [Acidobacteria bacterium]|nr:polyprenyl synthetase family protein [Acidobacteriota bacterium]
MKFDDIKPSRDNLKLLFDSEREQIDKTLDSLIPPEDEAPEILYKAMRHSVFAGGKRLRPILTAIAARGFEFYPAIIYPAGCAVELIHTYSLIHDDLPALDNDDLRRGKPTCHKVYGEAVAILAGDALNTLAFEVISSIDVPQSLQSRLLQATGELAGYAGIGGMVKGQVFDIESASREINPFELERIHENKTAALIVSSLRIGALLSLADKESVENLTKLGMNIGLAFQIKDDILDVTATSEELGKTGGKDAAQGKATYPSVHGMEKSVSELSRLSDEAFKIAEGFGDNIPWLYYIVEYLLQRSN